MTVATLLTAALLAYGLLLGGAFVFLRLHPDLASRIVFAWRRQSAAIAGSLTPVAGIVERARLATLRIELLGVRFGDRLAKIAGDARREVEGLARAAAERARQDAVTAAEAELIEAERRLSQAEEALSAASLDPAVRPAPAPPQPERQTPVIDPAQDPRVLKAVRRLELARADRAAAVQALAARLEHFLLHHRREQARLQLRPTSRRLAPLEGGGLEIGLSNAGPLAVTRVVLALFSDADPLASSRGETALAYRRMELSFAPEIVNDYEERILGLPPRFEWRTVVPLGAALGSGPGGVGVEVVEAEFAEPASLQRSSPYGSGNRVWSYPQAAPADLFAEDVRAAASGFAETARLASAEEAIAAAEADLLQAKAAAEERSRLLARAAAGKSEHQALHAAAAARLDLARADRDRLLAERDEIGARIELIRSGAETVVLSDRIGDGGWQASLEKVKASIAAQIVEARAREAVAATVTDQAGRFRFTGLPSGTYYIYSPVPDPPAGVIHYLQRIEFKEQGETVFEPSVAMTPEQFLHGAIEAGH